MPSDAGSYRFAGWTVSSAFNLPELRRGAGVPDWSVVRGAVSLADRHADWYQRTAAIDGDPWVWFGRRGAIDVIRFPGLGWCELDGARSRIACTWRGHLGDEEPQHLLINHVLPMALSFAGHLVLHASVAARPDGGAIAFVGPVGAGKSTLATFLGTRGWTVLSDDRLILDAGRLAYPAAPYVRISPEAAARLALPAALPPGHHKVRVPLGIGSLTWNARPRPLAGVVFLQHGSHGVRVEDLRGREASLEILTSILQLGLDRLDVKRRVFDRVAAIVESVPCRRLTLTKSWNSLREAEAAIGA